LSPERVRMIANWIACVTIRTLVGAKTGGLTSGYAPIVVRRLTMLVGGLELVSRGVRRLGVLQEMRRGLWRVFICNQV
jgi:hypothetical protein